MSRVAKAPAVIPAGVDAEVNGQVITIKGKSDELTRTLNDAVGVKYADNVLTFDSCSGYVDGQAQVGITRVLLDSVVIGVTEGFTKKLQLAGVGYRTAVRGDVVSLALGFPHPVEHELSAGITAECPTQTGVVLKDAGRQVIGQVAVDLRAYRHPGPCRGKGVRYADEVMHTKETRGKQGSTMDRKSTRTRRTTRARRKLQGLGATHLVMHHTPCHVYAQVVASDGSKVLVAASTVEKAVSEQLKYTDNRDATAAMGEAVTERTLEKGIKNVPFDRSGFQYHGRIQTLADATRKAGLQF